LSVKNFLDRAMRAARKFTMWDYAFFKTALVSLGILLGTYFSEFFSDHTLFLWIVFLCSYLIMIYRFFISHRF